MRRVVTSAWYLKLWVVNRGSFTGWAHLTIKSVLAVFKRIKAQMKNANDHCPVKRSAQLNYIKANCLCYM